MEKLSSKSRREFKDEKLKDKQIEEQLLKSLDGVENSDERFKLLLQRYVENEKLHRNYQQDQRVKDKQYDILVREKENLQKEMNKSILMREKLQDVCREQQRLIKSVKNESMQKIREEEELRKQNQTKFQGSLNEITKSLAKNNEENLKLRDHNIEMTNKLKFLAEQYRTREQQLEKLNEQVNLETQLHQAKLNKAQVQFAMEREILLREKQLALEKLSKTQEALKDMTVREIALKDQLNIYTTKYDDFQQSLQKSNDIFTTYKTEMEKMTKHTKKLEKESLSWKFKWEKSNATLIELATEKQERDEHAIRCNKQVDQLQKLLRALQNERTHLYKVLRENSIEIPPLPALPEEPELLKTTPINTGNERDKMEMMSKNCAELKATLANLQDQMKFLNLKGEMAAQAKIVQPQPEVTKKRQKRNKKSKNNNKNIGIEHENINESQDQVQVENEIENIDQASSPSTENTNEGSADQVQAENEVSTCSNEIENIEQASSPSTDESLVKSVNGEIDSENISTVLVNNVNDLIAENEEVTNNETAPINVDNSNENLEENHANHIADIPPIEASLTVPN